MKWCISITTVDHALSIRGGKYSPDPVNEETILTAPRSLDLVRSVKAANDIGGHYSRPYVFEFRVKTAGSEHAGASERES